MTAPLDRWLIAGTPTREPYPCMCRSERACGLRCVCRGRADWQLMDSVCCARKAGETRQRQANGEAAA